VESIHAVGINENGDREWRVASSYLLGEAVLGIPVDRQTNATTKHLADVMRTLGWSGGTTIRTTKRGYTKPIVEPKATIVEPKANEEPKAKIEPEGDGPGLAVREPPKLVLVRRLIRFR
jgi:hypothetical protein